MIQKVRMLLAYVRMVIFTNRIEWEIFQRIAPHIHNEKDHGYSFGSEQELLQAAIRGQRDAEACLEIIERQADHMGKAYGEAFRHIMYRDLNRRLLPYVKLAQHRVPPPLRVAEYAN